MPQAVVRLPLNRALKRALSSATYERTICTGLGYLDILYTYFARYPCLFKNFERIADQSGSKGAFIDYTASNPTAGIGFTLCFIAVSITSAVNGFYTEREKEEAEDNLYHALNSRVQHYLTVQDKSTRDGFNELLAQTLAASPSLKAKYKRLSLSDSDELEFALHDQHPLSMSETVLSKAHTLASSAWASVGIASFVYWIMWIGWGVLTGEFSPAGIGSLGMNSFVLPFIAGLAYPALKITHWLNNHYLKTEDLVPGEHVSVETDPALLEAANQDLTLLLKELVYIKEESLLNAELDRQRVIVPMTVKPIQALEMDEDLKSLGQNPRLKALGTFISVSVSSWIGAQYATWIICDALRVAVNITLNSAALTVGLGAAYLGVSLAYGAYQAFERYSKVHEHKAKIANFERQQNNQQLVLERAHEAKLIEIERLKESICSNSNSPTDNHWSAALVEKFKSSLMTSTAKAIESPLTWGQTFTNYLSTGASFLNGGTGGVMAGRLFLLPGTGLMPCILDGLSHVLMATIFVTLGVSYGVFKAYSAYANGNEAVLKASLSQRDHKIVCLQKQCDLADKVIALLNNKNDSLGALSPPVYRSPRKPMLTPSIHGFSLGSQQLISTKVINRSLFQPLTLGRMVQA